MSPTNKENKQGSEKFPSSQAHHLVSLGCEEPAYFGSAVIYQKAGDKIMIKTERVTQGFMPNLFPFEELAFGELVLFLV